MRIAALNLGVFVPAMWTVPQNPITGGMGRMGLGDDCPAGFILDPATGAVCIPADSPAAQAGTPGTTSGGGITLQFPYVTVSANTTPAPGTCPVGFVMHPSGAVCIPANSPAATNPLPVTSKLPAWALPAGIAAAVLLVGIVAMRR